jgi:hypothetical protein
MNENTVPMAIAYDLDETLAIKNMLTYILPALKMDSAEFLEALSRLPQEVGGDLLLVCYYLLHKQARELGIPLTREMLHSFGKYMEPFPGIPEYFPRINAYARKRGVSLEHFIISSNVREVIEGTCLAPYCSRIYASSFIYDEDGNACWPALVVNYTMKTQFLFRINKGCRDVFDEAGLNAETGDKRAIPSPISCLWVMGKQTFPVCMLPASRAGMPLRCSTPRCRTAWSRAEISLRRAGWTRPLWPITGKIPNLTGKSSPSLIPLPQTENRAFHP